MRRFAIESKHASHHTPFLVGRVLVFCVIGALAGCGGESKQSGGSSSNSNSNSTGDATASTSTSSTATSAGGTATSGETGPTSSSAGGTSSNGGSTETTGNDDSTSAGGNSAAGGAGGSFGGLDCPREAPDAGSDCSIETEGFPSAHCSWGDDPRPECRTRAICSGGVWSVQEPVGTVCDELPFPPGCTSEQPDNGTACDEVNLQCWYDDGTRCICSPCAGGSGYPVCGQIDPPQWWCTTPMDSCLVPAPQAGTPCEDPDASCGHDCALPILCIDGAWQYGQNGCPVCAAPDTPIATPSGDQPIARLRVGDLVYTVDHGAIVAAPLIRVGSTKVHSHQVMRVVLDDGASIEMSPGHPTGDGRRFGDLAQGDWLDATHQIVAATLVPFDASRTHDILPASSSGAYFAAGALVGSTLTP